MSPAKKKAKPVEAPEPRDPGAGWGDLMEDEPSMAPQAEDDAD